MQLCKCRLTERPVHLPSPTAVLEWPPLAYGRRLNFGFASFVFFPSKLYTYSPHVSPGVSLSLKTAHEKRQVAYLYVSALSLICFG